MSLGPPSKVLEDDLGLEVSFLIFLIVQVCSNPSEANCDNDEICFQESKLLGSAVMQRFI